MHQNLLYGTISTIAPNGRILLPYRQIFHRPGFFWLKALSNFVLFLLLHHLGMNCHSTRSSTSTFAPVVQLYSDHFPTATNNLTNFLLVNLDYLNFWSKLGNSLP